VIRVRARTNGAASPVPDPSAQLRSLIEEETRQTDAVSALGPDGAVIFCPATPEEGIRELARRLRVGAGELRIGVGTASFRADGLTLADVVSCASAREAAAAQGDEAPPPPPTPRNPRARSVHASGRSSRGVKRLFDLFVIVATAPLWLPLLGLIALAVKISDPRAPVFFVQERSGLGGARFRMYKFRTMVPEAELLKAELGDRNQRSWPDFKIDVDPRVTRIGRRLRASSLDELPQIWNILRGDMSLVGPRPTSFPEEAYQTWQTARFEAMPGLTGLWQVEARNCPDFSERIRLDIRYVENRGLVYDLKLLLRTVPAVLWDREGR
jgi:lipopolysaccharide/colanic/teichoic acid biosynthesis glycosyltransferase